eukprot:m.105602 g.105602  ORF g.105602 m.105602 type:complete len:380 (+) comp37230_c0_seq20:111-1250(+)
MKRFFCTAGNGMEAFLRDDIIERISGSDVEMVQGKVYFSTASSRERLLNIKAAERLFAFVLKDKYEGSFEDLIDACFLSNEVWMEAFHTWKSMQMNADGQKESGCVSASKRTKTGSGMEEGSSEASQCFSFRVSCKCAGRRGRKISPQVFGSRLGVAMTKKFGWKSDLRNPSFEVSVHLNDDGLVIGIPVTKIPLSNRSYLKTASGLRSTTAWALAKLADIEAGQVVLDPMCGAGTILIEAAVEWKDVRYIGCDFSQCQLDIAASNAKSAELVNIDFMLADATSLPLESGCVDRVICDLPFGLQHGNPASIKVLYPLFVKELERIVRFGGRAVLLTSLQNISLLVDIVESAKSFVVYKRHQLRLGALEAFALVLNRISC